MMISPSMVWQGRRLTKMPMHLAISEKLREQIASGVYAAGEQLPSEYELGILFGVSRTTVRRAIANLISQGLVSTHQGKGVFVKAQDKISFSLSNPFTFFDADLSQQGINGEIRHLSFEIIEPLPEVRQQLQLSSTATRVYQQQKVILANQLPIALDIAYFPLDIGETLCEQLQYGFTYATLDRNGYSLELANVFIEGTHATPEIGAYLEVVLGTPLLVYRYVAYSHEKRPVVCGKTLSRADCTCYSVQLQKPNLTS